MYSRIRPRSKPVKIRNGDGTLATGTRDVDLRLQRGKRHTHVGRVHGDAGIAGAEDRVPAVQAVDRGAAGARRVLQAMAVLRK